MSACVPCGAPGRVTLCPDCAVALRVELTDVPELLRDLDITRCRQDRPRTPYGRRPAGGEHPLPYRPRVADVVWTLHRALRTAASTLGMTGTLTTVELARWLLANMRRLRAHSGAGRLAQALTSAIHGARHVIDRPNDRRSYLGPCGVWGCLGQLYGVVDDRTALCPKCGAEHTIATRQAWLLDVVQGHLGSATEIAAFLRLTGSHCTASMIRNHGARGRLAPANAAEREQAAATGCQPPMALYRVSDVISALGTRYEHRKAS